jgi:DNA-binding XRE family transcriptional regulator
MELTLCKGYVRLLRARTREIPDMNRSPKRTPHKQLKIMRERLRITQQTAATMLNVSYPYYLSVETGQRQLSNALGQKIRDTFGLADVSDKLATPKIALGKGVTDDFTKERYEARLAKRPSFYIPEDNVVVTPTLGDYARCTHALLLAAEKRRRLKAVLQGFFEWARQSLSSDEMLDAFRDSFNEIFPGELAKSEAFLAVTTHWGLPLEDEVFRQEERRAARNTRQRKKRQE